MRSLIVTLTILIAAVGAFFVMDEVAKRSALAAVETRTREVAVAYADVLQANVTPLAQAKDLRDDQKALIGEMQQAEEAMRQVTPVDKGLEQIVGIQRVLQAFILKTTPAQSFLRKPSYTELKKVASSNGMSDILDEYNAAAKRWNDRQTGLLGELRTSIHGKAKIFPYLRSDGQTEDSLVIQL